MKIQYLLVGCFLLLGTLVFLPCTTTHAAEVNGIYTEPTTKDLGEVTKIDFFKGLKFRGWIDAYYVSNFNRPSRNTVNAGQGSSVVKGRAITIEGRTFDVHSNSVTLSLAEIELEKVPATGEIGFKFDLNFGETPEIIVDTIKGSVGPDAAMDSVLGFDKTFQHASIGYLAPIGRGLRLDFGKFVTHIGGETIETIKNNNYSHAFFYTYAIPFQDTGLRIHYDWSDTFYTEMYIVNGWNVTVDNNDGKTIGPSIGWAPSPKFSAYFNYLVGPERTNVNGDYRHLVDAQAFLNPIDPLNIAFNFDYGFEENVPSANGKNAEWLGLTGWLRYKVTEKLEPVVRVEYYRDGDAFTTGLKQTLWGYTLTLNYKLAVTKGSSLLVRPEIRYDKSSNTFFSDQSGFQRTNNQTTVGIGLVYYW
jgi:putative OmpL-like beta-barrel porin-2